ncbi:MAG: hypothetical protein GKR89_02215 [Candidatus Latescibacteria bacterium]|nr:hypothetical protein [Candidatus Latescibacterota bacterium]
MVIYFIYQLYTLIRILQRYSQDIGAGEKIVRTMQLRDRQKISRGGQRFQLVFGKSRLDVDEAFYQLVAVGDQVNVYTAKHSGWLLDATRETS